MLDKKQFIILFFSILIFISPLIFACLYCINNKYKKNTNIKGNYVMKYNRLEDEVEILSN